MVIIYCIFYVLRPHEEGRTAVRSFRKPILIKMLMKDSKRRNITVETEIGSINQGWKWKEINNVLSHVTPSSMTVVVGGNTPITSWNTYYIYYNKCVFSDNYWKVSHKKGLLKWWSQASGWCSSAQQCLAYTSQRWHWIFLLHQMDE